MSIELQRVEFRVIVTERDPDGTIVAERQLAEGAVFPSGLDQLGDGIRKLVAEAQTAPIADGAAA